MIRDAEGKYLTIFHKQKKERPWRFGGGKVEPDEQPIAAAARELWEELHIMVKSLMLIMTTGPEPIDGDSWFGFFYLAEPMHGGFAIMEPEKQGPIEFLTAEQLKERGSHPEYEVVRELERQEEIEAWQRL